jgi:hypothetical protein
MQRWSREQQAGKEDEIFHKLDVGGEQAGTHAEHRPASGLMP